MLPLDDDAAKYSACCETNSSSIRRPRKCTVSKLLLLAASVCVGPASAENTSIKSIAAHFTHLFAPKFPRFSNLFLPFPFLFPLFLPLSLSASFFCLSSPVARFERSELPVKCFKKLKQFPYILPFLEIFVFCFNFQLTKLITYRKDF